MTARPRGLFSLRDVMILVALTALGLAGGKIYADYEKPFDFPGPLLPFSLDRAIGALTVFLIVANVGLLVLWALRNRRTRHHHAPGAGTVANLAVLVAVAFIALTWADIILFQLYRGGRIVSRYPYHVVANTPYEAGPAVVISWAILALSQRWTATDWLERIGVALGIVWVGLYVHQNLLARWLYST